MDHAFGTISETPCQIQNYTDFPEEFYSVSFIFQSMIYLS